MLSAGVCLNALNVARRMIPMGRSKKRGRGRPRKSETKLSLWLDAAGMTRYDLADRLGIGRGHADRICRGERRPSLELAVEIEKLTRGGVPASYWMSIPKHSQD